MSAFQFKATSTKLKNRMWWQNFKVSCFPQKGSSIYCVHKHFRKIDISNTFISRTCACQEVRNVSFADIFAYVLTGCPQKPSYKESRY